MTLMTVIVLAAGLAWIAVVALVWLLCRAAARADADQQTHAADAVLAPRALA